MPDYIIDEYEENNIEYHVMDRMEDVIPEVDILYMTRVQKERFDETEYRHIRAKYILTPELLEEGFVREIVSKIQTMRKESGFEVMDHITVHLGGNEKLAEIALKNKDSISADVLAENILNDGAEGGEEKDINGEKLILSVKKV